MHDISEQRGTHFHGTEGWYVGPASDHYRCHRCYLPQYNRERITITVAWFPQNIPIPQVSTEDYLRQTVSYMLHILTTKDDTNSSTLKFGTPIFNAFRHISQILKRATHHLLHQSFSPTLLHQLRGWDCLQHNRHINLLRQLRGWKHQNHP